MIRNSVLVKINNSLGSHRKFEASDFRIDLTKEPYYTLVQITYLGNTEYNFHFSVPRNVSLGYSGGVVPGSASLKEEFKEKDIDQILINIENWLVDVWDEISATPILRLQKEQEDFLNEILGKVDTMSTDFYTVEEGTELSRRLDDLEERYRDLIENLINDSKDRDAKIQILAEDIETLRSTINAVPKGFWNRSLLSKFTKIARWGADKDNRALLKEIIDLGTQAVTGQKLLGE